MSVVQTVRTTISADRLGHAILPEQDLLDEYKVDAYSLLKLPLLRLSVSINLDQFLVRSLITD